LSGKSARQASALGARNRTYIHRKRFDYSRIVFTYERAVRFHEVDPAGILFFPHFSSYAHEAMERFFDPLEGGYAGLVVGRRIGLPAVRVESEFKAPLAFGDDAHVRTSVSRLGNRSFTLRYRFVRGSDGVEAASMLHTVVSTDLVSMKSRDMPEDVRRIVEAHLELDAT
jgi:4-hydroxybenzoyl-CoA thioesterase